jgi:hypothetical protein
MTKTRTVRIEKGKGCYDIWELNESDQIWYWIGQGDTLKEVVLKCEESGWNLVNWKGIDKWEQRKHLEC